MVAKAGVGVLAMDDDAGDEGGEGDAAAADDVKGLFLALQCREQHIIWINVLIAALQLLRLSGWPR